jgi:hypothetical protein
VGRQTHWEGAARRAWAEAPVQTRAVDPMEADPWVSSEVVGIAAAVVAAAFAVVMTGVVVGAETVVVVAAAAAAAAVVAAAVAVVAAAVAVVVVAAVAVAVAAPQGSASYEGAYDPGGTGHFLVMLGADNPVSHTLTDATI